MEELVKSMRVCLSNTFVLYFKAHAFHWNVEGIHFPTYHGFFGDFYADLYGAVDPTAEEIRALGVYAPTGLNELYKDATISDSVLTGNDVPSMLQELIVGNNVILSNLLNAFTIATKANQQGLADFLAGRIDIHKKHKWMLESCAKGM